MMDQESLLLKEMSGSVDWRGGLLWETDCDITTAWILKTPQSETCHFWVVNWYIQYSNKILLGTGTTSNDLQILYTAPHIIPTPHWLCVNVLGSHLNFN